MLQPDLAGHRIEKMTESYIACKLWAIVFTSYNEKWGNQILTLSNKKETVVSFSTDQTSKLFTCYIFVQKEYLPDSDPDTAFNNLGIAKSSLRRVIRWLVIFFEPWGPIGLKLKSTFFQRGASQWVNSKRRRLQSTSSRWSWGSPLHWLTLPIMYSIVLMAEIRRSPPGMYKTLQIMVYLPYQLVQDFSHQR